MVNNYLKLVRFSHTLFALPFALASFFLAVSYSEARLSWQLLALVVVAVIFARNAAMAFNRLADRNYDSLNPRTIKREIPAGTVSARSAIVFVVINAILFMLTAWLINPLCFALSPLALIVILGYSLTKRFTALCHLILGTGLALAPLGAWLAVTGQFNIIPILIAIAVLLWVAGFDIIYSLQDESFDQNHRLKSIPAAFGRKKSLIISSLIHAVCFLSMIAVSFQADFSIAGWAGTAAFGSLLVYQHLIISTSNISRVNIAFFTTNGVASLLWSAAVITDTFLK